MSDVKCRWTKLVDWYEVCEPVETKYEPEEKGSFLGWFICAVSCSNYTHGFKYDYLTDICSCRGKWISPIWRR